MFVQAYQEQEVIDQLLMMEFRTSSTCNLFKEDPLVVEVKEKVANLIGYPIEMGEDLQGQKYEPGQFFKPHYDFFEGDSYTKSLFSFWQ